MLSIGFLFLHIIFTYAIFSIINIKEIGGFKMFNENTYKEDVKLFKKILSIKADELISKEGSTIIYIGRSTCPFCRKFAKKLNALVNKINTPIYYIDTEDFSDNEIKSFRDKYNIITVPGFIVSKQGEVEVRCDSSMSEDEILELIN